MAKPTRAAANPAAIDLVAHPNPFVRIKERDKSAFAALGQGLRNRLGEVIEDRRPAKRQDDYTQIDPSLSIAPPSRKQPGEPAPGVGYAGLDPIQRRWFLEWLASPDQSAPSAFQNLYVAYLEIALFETGQGAQLARHEIDRLLSTPAWQSHAGLLRAWMLGGWLAQDGPSLAAWPPGVHLGEEALWSSLGLQAQLAYPLQPQQALTALAVVGPAAQGSAWTPDVEIMKHRLGSLAATLGHEILAHALATVDPAELTPRPWRCAHRDLRFALPQPNLAPILRPLLPELLIQQPAAHLADQTAATDEAKQNDGKGWTLTLEFQESRSQYFDYVMSLVRKQPTFSQILDENRRMVYRVTFAQNRLRPFWQIWEYVSKWANINIYVNGKELQAWQVWQYSPYMRG